MKRLCLILFCLFYALPARAAETLPRTIIVLYDSQEDKRPRNTRTHLMVDMPLNHLGYILDYHDVNKPLPPLGPDVKGILVWFRVPTELKEPAKFIDWANSAIDSGKKVILLGHYGIGGKFRDGPGGMAKVNSLLKRLGVTEENNRITLTYESRVSLQDPATMGFERKLDILLMPFFETHKTDPVAKSYLRVQHSAKKEGISDLVVVNKNGAYVAEDYAIYSEEKSGTQRWYLDPFKFFREALGDAGVPVPDATTLMGRRIFYSQIDGDGWNNLTELEKYKNKQWIAAEVVTEEIFKLFPDLAFNIGLITSELDPRCYGYAHSIPAALAMLKLPNVEASSHSHSHPLYWNFFADGFFAKEKRLLSLYPAPPPQRTGLMHSLFGKEADDWTKVNDTKLPPSAFRDPQTGEDMFEILKKYFGVPRSYACKPFSLGREVEGSIAYINALSPKEKPVRLFQWSGDTSPFPEALAEVSKAGMQNINGGDTRFDSEYPSYSWVAPLGIKNGPYFQVFSSNSNENTYTHLWTDRYYGFRYLQTTILNTESPIRIKPFNVYFHVFSGEKQASLSAVVENLKYAQKAEIVPITASRYAAQAQGFYTARMLPIGKDTWKIINRGDLQTLRIDRATLKQVDFSRSSGIIGQRHYQGSLYVALDRAAAEPILALSPTSDIGKEPEGQKPYLIESRWSAENVTNDGKALRFTAQGYGKGEMRWFWPYSGPVNVKMQRGKKIFYEQAINATNSGSLNLSLPGNAIEPVEVTFTFAGPT